jgi:predicted RNase H-like nuclease (RuvC/YqgF family)
MKMMMKKMMMLMVVVGLGIGFFAAPLQGQTRYGDDRVPGEDYRFGKHKYEHEYGVHENWDFRRNRRQVKREIRRNEKQIRRLRREVRRFERRMNYRHMSRRQYRRAMRHMQEMRYEMRRLIKHNRYLKRMLLVRAYRY